jgi:peptidoglycan/LPS O-acetylase OafA/YrhL
MRAEHLPSLDGLRAISIVLVLLGHLGGTVGFPRIDLKIGDYSHLGVIVFFVISGYLITRLMLIEDAKNGRISLRRFYERRALRLFPAAYTYIACACLLSVVGFSHMRATDIWHAVTYTVNFLPGRAKLIGHLWSLSVEEQFYLLWPCTFVILGARKSGWAAVATILFGPVARAGAWLFLRGTPYGDVPMFPLVADSIAMGCLLANVSGWFEQKNWYLRLFRPGYSLGLLALLLLINRYMDYTVVSVIGASILNLCLAILIHRSVYHSEDWVGRILNWRPLAWIGVLSYSLYLWQQIFLNRESISWVNRFPQNILLTIVVALSSYFLLEQPLIKLRRRLRAY